MPEKGDWVVVSVVAGRTTAWQANRYASLIYKNGKFSFKFLPVR
jgi:hypothetical protein